MVILNLSVTFFLLIIVVRQTNRCYRRDTRDQGMRGEKGDGGHRVDETGGGGSGVDWSEQVGAYGSACRALWGGYVGECCGVCDQGSDDVAFGVDRSQIKKLQDDIARLRRQVRGLTQNAARVTAPSPSPFKFGEGDNAILSSKPIMGLRCMSCDRSDARSARLQCRSSDGRVLVVARSATVADCNVPWLSRRPLDEVQDQPGAYLPNAAFPARTPDLTQRSKGTAVRDPEDSSASLGAKRPSTVNAGRKGARSPVQTSPERRPPAEKTPANMVGPILPPGGWRGNNDYVETSTDSLPAVGRGASRAQLAAGASRSVVATGASRQVLTSQPKGGK